GGSRGLQRGAGGGGWGVGSRRAPTMPAMKRRDAVRLLGLGAAAALGAACQIVPPAPLPTGIPTATPLPPTPVPTPAPRPPTPLSAIPIGTDASPDTPHPARPTKPPVPT